MSALRPIWEFNSNIFLVDKKDRGNLPVTNLKNLNQFIPYQHLKIEDMFILKDFFGRGIPCVNTAWRMHISQYLSIIYQGSIHVFYW